MVHKQKRPGFGKPDRFWLLFSTNNLLWKSNPEKIHYCFKEIKYQGLPGLGGFIPDFFALACVLRNTSDAAAKAVTPAFFMASLRVIFSAEETRLLMLLFTAVH